MNCPLYKMHCGGCEGLRTPYGELLKEKTALVRRLFPQTLPAVGMETPLHYRCKVISTFARSDSGIISGIYALGSHRVLPVRSCCLHDRRLDEITEEIRGLVTRFGIVPYDEDAMTGTLRHVQLRRGARSGQVLVTLITACDALPRGRELAAALMKACPDVRGVVQNINPRKTSAVMGFRERVLAGQSSIEDTLCGCRFRISSRAFCQVNPVQAEKLYKKAIELAALTGEETVVDAYCGIGAVGLIAAPHAKHVIGIEFNGDAVRDARANASLNGLTNTEFIAGDAGKVLCELDRHAQVVFVDPPRAGCTPLFLDALRRHAPDKIVYISCCPDTLRRDVTRLEKAGYRTDTVQPFDLFPYTGHVETVCLLVLRNPVTHVNIDVDVEELVQDKRGQATYEQIRDYVMEQTGLHVTNLNIAQIKRKCGIIERENYNLPKSEDSKQPQCPPEKETAIKEALKHFGMI